MKKMSHTFRYKQKHIYEIDMSLWCLCFCCCKTPLTTEVSTCIVADVMPPYTLAGTAYLCVGVALHSSPAGLILM